MNSQVAAVAVADLHFSYQQGKKSFEALRGVSFEAPAGQITGLLGPNGSGKSTTFKILSTQIAPSQGDAFVNGISTVRERDRARREIGVTFQSPSLDPMLTVRENLQIFAALFGLSKSDASQRIDELLRIFRVLDRASSRVKELSGGLARRVELAKSLLSQPRVLLLDEPTTGLDPRARYEFWTELKELVQVRKMSLLVTTHLMDEAELCDRLVFLAEGRVAAVGTPLELKKAFGADVIIAQPSDAVSAQTDAWISSRLGLSDKWTLVGGRYRIETSDPQRVFQSLASQIGDHHLQHLEWGKPTLADVYFSKTGKSL